MKASINNFYSTGLSIFGIIIIFLSIFVGFNTVLTGSDIGVGTKIAVAAITIDQTGSNLNTGAGNPGIITGNQNGGNFGDGGSANGTVVTPGPNTSTAPANSCSLSTNNLTTYCMLAPVNGLFGDSSGHLDVGQGVGPFFATLYKVGVTIAIALSIVMISFGGIRLATTDSVSGTEEGKKMVNAALAGLFLALFSYVLLYTINPALVSNNVTGDPVFTTQTGH